MSSKKSSDPLKYIDRNGFILRNDFPIRMSDFQAVEKTRNAAELDKLGFRVSHRGCEGRLGFFPSLDRPHSIFHCSENGPFNSTCNGTWEVHQVESMTPQQLQKAFHIRLPDFDWEYEVIDEANNGIQSWTYSRPATIHEIHKINADALEYRRKRARH